MLGRVKISMKEPLLAFLALWLWRLGVYNSRQLEMESLPECFLEVFRFCQGRGGGGWGGGRRCGGEVDFR